jgi:hypothetical protein
VLRETTSRGPVWTILTITSRTSERGGEGDCVKEGEEKGSARGSVHWGCFYATALDIEVDPERRCFGCREMVGLSGRLFRRSDTTGLDH